MKSFSWLFFALPAAAQYPVLNDSAWAGPAMQRDSKSTSTPANFTSASGTLIVPSLSIPERPKEVADQYSVSFWVGMEGVPENNAPFARGLWQAGIQGNIYVNGTKTYIPWYEWIPEDPVRLPASDLVMNEGDHIYINVSTADLGYTGTIVLTNLNTTQEWTITRPSPVTPRGPTWHAPGWSAEWIAEAATYGPETMYRKYILADFGNATFLDPKVCRTDNVCLGPEGQNTTIWDLVDDKLYSRTSVGKDVTIEYLEVDL
ncbi:hypothetical protein HYALB_00004342 [Hymenoscyphus albidus]|uniref:Concanavalin A-like lectin/glucanase n=1 Tax=Hymenoscyphus albidus TaxID=595503 RepID=A0A9N9M5M7_9HELO|nr:hypothetical protein HYALB_00004342 [Hymenoscyphus albidus]